MDDNGGVQTRIKHIGAQGSSPTLIGEPTMRKLILPLAAAGTALAVATPAAAQNFPQPQNGYGAQPYTYPAPQYGYGNGYGAQNLAMRVDMVQRRIEDLRRAHVLRGDRAERLRKEARQLQRRVRQTSGYGIAQFAAGDLQMRLARLEQQVNYAASAGRYGGYGSYGSYGSYGYPNGQGYNGYGQPGYDNRDRDDGGRYDRDDDD
jgi:hypothetical protein